ncbi:hypothetical protein V496_05062, partial [Pseudogymnoascus sp. VKM F-4515 (FW-2607)]
AVEEEGSIHQTAQEGASRPVEESIAVPAAAAAAADLDSVDPDPAAAPQKMQDSKTHPPVSDPPTAGLGASQACRRDMETAAAAGPRSPVAGRETEIVAADAAGAAAAGARGLVAGQETQIVAADAAAAGAAADAAAAAVRTAGTERAVLGTAGD